MEVVRKCTSKINESVAKSPVGYYFRLDGSGHPLAREGSNFTCEIRAGLLTFAAMAYSTWAGHAYRLLTGSLGGECEYSVADGRKLPLRWPRL